MRFMRRYKIVLIIFVVLILGFISVFFLMNNKASQEDPISNSIKQQVDYTLYYPAKLSDDFHFDEIAFDQETKVVTYKYSSSDKSIFFSLQKKPDGLNYDEFRNKQMTGIREVKTSIGTASAGTLQNQTVSSLLTDNTWVLITAGPGTSIDDLEQASKALTEIQ